MSEITKIELQKRKGRYNVYLDGEFAFGVSENLLVKENLKVGKSIDLQYYHKLVYGNAVDKLLDKAKRFLSYRPRSEKEIRDYLWRKVKSQKLKVKTEANDLGALVDHVVGKLRKRGHVDDPAFASWWVEERIRSRPRGKLLLRSELYKKGVEQEIIAAVLNNYSREDEISWAERLVEKKASRYEGLEPRERRKKLSAYLHRRGFSWGIINTVLGG